MKSTVPRLYVTGERMGLIHSELQREPAGVEIVKHNLQDPFESLLTNARLVLLRNKAVARIGSVIFADFDFDERHFAENITEILERTAVDAFGDPLRITRLGTNSAHTLYVGNAEHAPTMIRPGAAAPSWEVITSGTRPANLQDEFFQMVDDHVEVLNGLLYALAERTGGAASDDVRYYSIPIIGEPAKKPEGIQEIRTAAEEVFEKFVGVGFVVEELVKMAVLGRTDPVLLAQKGIRRKQAALLYGKSGVGKTEMGKSLATALDAKHKYIKFSDVQDIYVGAWARSIGEIFDEAFGYMDGNIVIHFDEFDGLIKTGNPHSTQNVMAVLKQKLEELQEYPHVFFLGTTNDIKGLDPAVIADKRMPVKLHIPLPSKETIALVWGKVLGVEPGVSLSEVDLDSDNWAEVLESASYDCGVLADACGEFSPGDIVSLVEKVRSDNFLLGLENEPSQHQLLNAIDYARKHRPQDLLDD